MAYFTYKENIGLQRWIAPRVQGTHSFMHKCIWGANYVPGKVVTEPALDSSLKQNHVQTIASICGCLCRSTPWHTERCALPSTAVCCHCLLDVCECSALQREGVTDGPFCYGNAQTHTWITGTRGDPTSLHSASGVNLASPPAPPPHGSSCLIWKSIPVAIMS